MRSCHDQGPSLQWKFRRSAWMLKWKKWDIKGRWEKYGEKRSGNQEEKEAERFKRWLEQLGKRRINISWGRRKRKKEHWVIQNYFSEEKQNLEIVYYNKKMSSESSSWDQTGCEATIISIFLTQNTKLKKKVSAHIVHSVTVERGWTEKQSALFPSKSMPPILRNFSKSHLPTTRSKHIIQKKRLFFLIIFQRYNLEMFSNVSSSFICPFSRYVFPVNSDYWCLWGIISKQTVQTLVPAATSVSSCPLVMRRSVVINFALQCVGQQESHMDINVY